MQTGDETIPSGDTTGTDTATGDADTKATETTKPEGSDVKPPEGDTPASEKTEETDASKTTDGKDTPPVYTDFVVPEGMALDAKAVEKFTPLLQKHNLTQEAAQELVSAYAEHMQGLGAEGAEAFAKAYKDHRDAEIAQANTTGMAAIKADPEIGGAQYDAVRNRVVDAVGTVGTTELRAKFESLGLGNDPDIVRFIHRLIDYRPQDRGEAPHGAGGDRKSPAAALYGGTKP